MSDSTVKYMDLATKILSISVIPLFLWGVKVEVDNAVRDQQVIQLEREIEGLRDINDTVQEYAIKLSKVDQKLEAMDDIVMEIRQDIKDLLRRGM